jgi:hypothetical protein
MFATAALVVIAAVVAVLQLRADGDTADAAPERIHQSGSRIRWAEGEWYQHGVNVPWYNWGCDFGCRDDGGVSSSTISSVLNDQFDSCPWRRPAFATRQFPMRPRS